jgi:hypothetical protein
MPTEALKTLVLPVLNRAPFAYDVCGKADSVTFIHKFSQFTSKWRIVDYPKSHVLSIEAYDIVPFSPEAPGIHKRLYERSDKSFGKFTLEMGVYKYDWVPYLKYVLELPYVDETTPAAFEHAFTIARDAVGTTYHGWLKASNESRCSGSEGIDDKGLFDRIKDAFG